MVPARPSTVVVDTSVLINFLHLDRLDLLGLLPALTFVYLQEVETEILRFDQKARLSSAVLLGHLALEISEDPQEMALGAEFRRTFDRGESTCLAMAVHRGWQLACDERGRFLSQAKELVGLSRLHNTAGLLVRCIRSGLLTVIEADLMKNRLEAHRFRLPFASFAAVLSEQPAPPLPPGDL